MFLALKEMKRAKLRYILLSLIMISILFLVFFMTGLANGLSFADSSSLQKIKGDYIVTNKEAEGAVINSELSKEQLKEISNSLEEPTSPLALTMSTIAGKTNQKDTDMIYFSVDPEHYGDLNITEGKNISDITDKEVLVNKSFKEDGYELNDQLVDESTGETMTIAGFIENQTYSFLPVVYSDIDSEFQPTQGSEIMYNAIVYNGPKMDIKGYDTSTNDEIVQSMPGYSETQGSFNVMKAFMFIISAFVSTVFFYVLTIQKTNQFGILKAMGATTSYISTSIVTQVLLLTLISLSVSVLAVAGMAQVLPEGIPFQASVSLVLGTGALFIILNLAGSLLSLYKVTKIDPLEAIGRSE
ncbi:ABC transporter permease [Thalassobacillus sp. CUG 92003]|uniref:ABC transporter permease n=1 Tax=Thalassobacillus sp. CUG 92003 TaxID=2736641 RepID=UPI0015E680F3|nr:ABC transporter permease [Thalassobacillus sp. CUG 92003]